MAWTNAKTVAVGALVLVCLATTPAIVHRYHHQKNNNTTTSVQPADTIRAGQINYINIPLQEVLPVYHALTHAELDTSQIRNLLSVAITYENNQDLTRSEAIQELDKVLVQQAGIVATHPNENQIIFKRQR